MRPICESNVWSTALFLKMGHVFVWCVTLARYGSLTLWCQPPHSSSNITPAPMPHSNLSHTCTIYRCANNVARFWAKLGHTGRICAAYASSSGCEIQRFVCGMRHYRVLVGCHMGWQGGTCTNSATPHTMYPYSHTLHNTIYMGHKKVARVWGKVACM